MADIKNWSATAASNNATPPDGWPEGQAASTVNDCAREMMAALRRWYVDAEWIDRGDTPTRVDNDTFTVSGDLTAVYHTGRRLRVSGSATGYCTVSSSSYSSPNTTVNVTMDAGNLPATLSAVSVAILSATNHGIPSPLPAISGANLTGLNASNVSSGTLADGRLSSNVALKDAANTFAETQTLSRAGVSTWQAINSSASITSWFGSESSAGYIGTQTTHPFKVYTNNTERGSISASGNWTINAPASGTALQVNGASSTATINAGATELPDIRVSTASVSLGMRAWESSARGLFGTTTNHPLHIRTNDTDRVVVAATGGVQFGAPTGGDKGAGTLNTAGAIYQNNVAVNSLPLTNSTSTTLVKGQIHHITGNATLPALAAGEWICVVNNSGSAITITENSGDTTYWTTGAVSVSTLTVPARGRIVASGAGSSVVYVSGDISGYT